jgi:serine/threonine protein kinase
MMDSQRWKQIDEIFHAALERDPPARAAFLTEACKEDESLRAEIEALIASHEKESSLFETPASDLAAEFMAKDQKETIAHYQILKKIGSGGMGEVYLAEDTRLNRKVALKLLPSEFTNDRDRVRRFEREAKTASSLNHPNILTIYDIGQFNSSSFIASEYIDGETLRQRMRESKMPLKEILAISIQVAEALDAAHGAGIIHRDIKPENIMIRSDGYAKVLDFGLAKLTKTKKLSESSQLETVAKTEVGVVLGTIRYMSPEQARGLNIDARTDLFSFGVVLYEMISGKVPFDGATSSDVIAAILEKHPGPLVDQLPDDLKRIVTKALAKDPDERYQTAKDLIADLRRIRKQLEISEELKSSRLPGSEVHRILTARRLIELMLITSLITATILVFNFLSAKKTLKKRDTISTQRQITFTGTSRLSEISPDGKFIAFYQPPNQVFVQSVEGGNPLRVLNQGKEVWRIRWAPDSSKILIVCDFDDRTRAFLVSPFGGQPRQIDGWPINCWSPDGTHLANAFQDSKEIVISDIGSPDKFVKRKIQLPTQFLWLFDIDWSRDGRFALLLSSDNKNVIATMKEDGSQGEIVVNDTQGQIGEIRWACDSKAIYYWKYEKENQTNLMKVEISRESGKSIGRPKLVLSDPNVESGLSFSCNGILAYDRGTKKSNLLALKMDNQKWSTYQLTQGTWSAAFPSVSPDGSTVAFSLNKEGNRSIFTMPVTGGDMRQLTFEDDCNRPAWSPSGKTIAAVCIHDNLTRVVTVSTEDSFKHEFKSTKVSENLLVSWAPGNLIIYQTPGNRNYDFLDPQTEKETPLLPDSSRGWIFNALVSPDQKKAVFAANWPFSRHRGIWVENLSKHTGTLLVEAFPPAVSVPLLGWSLDSKWIYYRRRVPNKNNLVSLFKLNIDSKKEESLPSLEIGKDQTIEWMSMGQDEKTFVASVAESETDVWTVKNFDPEITNHD